MNSDSKTNT